MCSGSAAASATATETYTYDDLQRLTGASRTWTGMTWSPPTTPGDTYTYDDLGNIRCKSDYGDAYNYDGPRPHAVEQQRLVGDAARPAGAPVQL